MKISAVGKRLLIGRRLANDELGDTLLPKRIALPVFASDALSSVAYAPDEILLTLSLAGMAGIAFSWQIAVLVAVVMLVVVASYRQVVHAYPSGGGDYEVATTNLGPTAGITVASALLVDYVLTVAVSVSSGIQNAKAVLTFLQGNEGIAAAVVIVVLMLLNLRGMRESGTLFAVPTYLFMASVLIMVAVGLLRIFVLGHDVQAETAAFGLEGDQRYQSFAGIAMVALMARAFSSGCAALTGVEAISNGVPAFREPKSKNAATTLGLLGVVAITMLLGIVFLARHTGLKIIDPGRSWYTLDGQRIDVEGHTVMAQLAQAVFADFTVGFVVVVSVTMLILFLAANTAFNGFPVLASVLARDGFLPRQLRNRGDRLSYSNGIVILGIVAALLVLVFRADVTALIQLYVVGVFVSFTISQIGMVRHWTRHLGTETNPVARRQMTWSRGINTFGAALTGTVLIVVLISKFTHGAWLAIAAMALVFVVMKAIRRHYQSVAAEMVLDPDDHEGLPSRVHAVVLVSRLHKATLRAVFYARATGPNFIEAITVDVDPDDTRELLRQWDEHGLDIPLRVIASPYRDIVTPIVDHVRSIRTHSPRDVVCIYIPEYVVGHWWEAFLHNQTALRLRAMLHFTPGVMVTSVPYRLASFRRKAGLPGAPPPSGTGS